MTGAAAGWGRYIFACTTVCRGTRANVHTLVVGSWEGWMIWSEKTPCVGESDTMGPTDIINIFPVQNVYIST